MNIQEFYDPITFTLTYIVYDSVTRDALVIDPVLDYNPSSGHFFYESADKILSFVEEKSLRVKLILETHIHADHLSSSAYLKEQILGVKTGISFAICQVQKKIKKVFHLKNLITDGHQFDYLFTDGEEIEVGSLKFKVLHSPGHTPACCSFLFDGFIFTGDALFMPDYGTGRCDFPGGSADDLYHSIANKLYKLDDSTVVYVGHDYCPKGREMDFKTTIGESKKYNIRLKDGISQEEFVRGRNERDLTLSTPRLLYPSIQVNINGGALPKKESNGIRYLKIPIDKHS